MPMQESLLDFKPNLREGHEFNISKLRQWSVGAAVALLALAGAILVLLDWRDVQGALVQADWRPILFGLGVTGGSYAVQSYSFGLLNRSFGVRLGLTHLLSIGFVSSVMIALLGERQVIPCGYCLWRGAACLPDMQWRHPCFMGIWRAWCSSR
jgi:hypothetical protein